MIGLTRNAKTSCLLVATLFLSALMVMGDADWSFAKGGGGGRGGGGGGGGGRGGGAHVGGGGGGGANVRTGRSSVVSHKSSAVAGSRDVNRSNVNVNRRDVNVNRSNVNVHNRDVYANRNVDIDIDHHYGRGWGAAAVGTAAVVGTAVAVGTYAATLPTGCSAVNVGGVVYQRCGPTYYMPVYQGSTVTYEVVAAP